MGDDQPHQPRGRTLLLDNAQGRRCGIPHQRALRLLCGYDLNANTVTVCDPLEGKIQYDMDKFENRYQLVYQQAVVLRKPESLTGTETETTEMFVQ